MTRWLGALMMGLKLVYVPEVTGLSADCCGLKMFSMRVLLKGTSCGDGGKEACASWVCRQQGASRLSDLQLSAASCKVWQAGKHTPTAGATLRAHAVAAADHW